MANEDDQKTYSIWAFLGVFAFLSVVGIIGILLVGNTTSDTVQIQERQRTTTTALTTTTAVDGEDPPVTMPDGSPLPEGVQDVISVDGATSYAFVTPQELAQVPIRTIVAPATAVPNADGTALDVTVTCASGIGEALAQISVTEDPSGITVLPVVLVPADSAPCDPASVLRTITLPLASPVGARPILLVPAGTEVPTPVAR